MLSEYLAEFAQGDLEATAQPIQSGLVKRTVADLQRILIALGWKATTIPRPGAKDFGLYGPKTAGAWGQSATTRKLNPTFNRASSTEAYVDPQTLAVLGGGVSVPVAAPAPVTPAATIPAAQPAVAAAMVATPVSNAFDILFALGWKKRLTRATTYTKNLAQSWGISARSRHLPMTLTPASTPGVVLVDQSALTAMEAEARSKAVAPGTPTTEVAVPGTAVKTVGELQTILYGVGWTTKKLANDPRFGPQTKKAWTVSANTRKLPTTFERVDATHARVAQATYDKMAADAGITTKPTEPEKKIEEQKPAPASDLIDKPVADAQKLLIKLRWKPSIIPRPGAKDFGLYGQKTKGAWEQSTKTRNLDQTFERVDGKTARLNAKSYVTLLEIALGKKADDKPKPDEKPEEKKTEPEHKIGGPDTANPILPIVTAYDYLRKLGWDKKLPQSDKFTPALVHAWQWSAKKRGLDPRITAYKTDMIAAAPRTIGQFAKEASGVKPKNGEPTGSVTVLVSEMQGILIALGEPKTRLTDGRFGSTTQLAWQRVASSRNLNPGVTAKVNDKSAKVSQDTFDKLKAEAAKPGPVVKTTETEKILVLTVQQGLNVQAQSKLVTDGTWGSKTETALRGWLNKQPGGRTVKVVVLSKAKGSSQLELPKAIVQVLRESSKLAPTPTGTEDEKKAAAVIMQAATQEVSVLSLQHMLTMARIQDGNVPPFSMTGTWDPSTREAFMYVFKSSATAPVQKVWRIALEKLVSKDMRSIKLPPQDAAVVVQGEELWKSKGSPNVPVNGGGGGGGTTGGGGGGGGGAEDTGGGGGSAEDTGGGGGQPAAAATPEAIWDGAVQALRSVYDDGTRFLQAVQEREAKSWHLTPDAVQALDSWAQAADRVKQRTAQVLENSPQAISALDAAGGVAPGMSGLEAYFSDLSGVASEILEALKLPLGAAAAPMQGLEQWAQAAAVAERLGGAVWPKLLQLLNSPTVKSGVVTYLGVKGVGDALNADVVAYKEIRKHVADLVAEGKLTVEEAGPLNPTAPSSAMGMLVLGVVAVGGLAVYLSMKKKAGNA